LRDAFGVGDREWIEVGCQRQWDDDRPLCRVHQHGWAESDGADEHEYRHKFAEPVQLSDSEWKLHVVCAGGREAEHEQSDVGGGEVHGDLRDLEQRWEQRVVWRGAGGVDSGRGALGDNHDCGVAKLRVV